MAQLHVAIILDSGDRIGPGKIAMLESIKATGSIAAAAREMGIDYKRAWMMIESINQAFKVPAVERVMGGSGGGGAKLTPLGDQILEVYKSLEAQTLHIGHAELSALEKKALKLKRKFNRKDARALQE
jgi:molybdate transport system regulatory protein